jgi:hypothetical protein
MKVIRLWFRRQRKFVIFGTIKFRRAFKRERKETVVAAKILRKLIKDENSVTEDEIRFLKSQSADLGKAIGLVGLQFVPGSSFGIIALEKIAKKKGVTLFPKENNIPTNEDTTS